MSDEALLPQGSPFSLLITQDMARSGTKIREKRQADADTLALFTKVAGIVDTKMIKVRIEALPKYNGYICNLDIQAELVRECVISLDPFDEVLDLHHEVPLLLPDAFEKHMESLGDDEDSLQEDLFNDDPECLADAGVDVGALILELVAVGMSVHPKKPGVVFDGLSDEDLDGAESDQEPSHRPFEALKELMDRKDDV